MKCCYEIFFILMMSSLSLKAQSIDDSKRNAIGIGTSWFPAYLFKTTQVIDHHGIIFSYKHKINRSMGIRTGVIYNTRIGINNASKLGDKGYFIATYLGIDYEVFSFRRWDFFSAIDICYSVSRNNTYNYLPDLSTYGQKYEAGVGLGFNFKISPSFVLQTETNFMYGHIYYKDTQYDKILSSQDYWGFDSFKFLSLQLFYKF